MKEIILPHKCNFQLNMFETDASKAKCIICGKGIMDDYVPEPPSEIKPLEFKRYRSIHDTGSQKVINKAYEEGLDAYSWVATNKYHGTNFSLLADSEKILACSRNQIIPEGESHFGHEVMLLHLNKIIKAMQSYFGKNIQVFFELFGGSYPHPDVSVLKNFSRVAKGVYYCPWIDIRVIDIKVEGKYLDYDEMVEIALRHSLAVAALIARGTLDEMLALDPNFEDETYKHYNLPKIEGNISEGLVIRPTKDLYFKNGERVMLKKKSESFKAKKREPKAKQPDIELSAEANEIFNELSSYVTEARFDSIISHGGKYTAKDFGKLVGLMMSDIMEEVDLGDSFDSITKAEKKHINQLLMKEIGVCIRPLFINLVSEF